MHTQNNYAICLWYNPRVSEYPISGVCVLRILSKEDASRARLWEFRSLRINNLSRTECTARAHVHQPRQKRCLRWCKPSTLWDAPSLQMHENFHQWAKWRHLSHPSACKSTIVGNNQPIHVPHKTGCKTGSQTNMWWHAGLHWYHLNM